MSTLKIKWSFYAKRSLDLIVACIEADSPSNAKMVKRTLVSLVGSIIDFPEKFPTDPFIPKSKGNFRFVSRWNYKIVYEITPNEIIIIDIFHTAQSPEKIEDAVD
ncbi:MAG: type II toxin-antitoxin system RelE/ParE family toxin [Bacteroidia bacterium]|nr:type II toxin-antitoxin system RelE/ParE family toxin [Bacteroidia bacterium]